MVKTTQDCILYKPGVELLCPNCKKEMFPTCLGCGSKYSCDHCGYEENCGCTDFE